SYSIPPSASARHHPLGWSPDPRALAAAPFRIARPGHACAGVSPPPPAAASRCVAPVSLVRPFHARASRSTPQWTGALRPTRSARARASAPPNRPLDLGGFPMKRAHALILTVVAMAFTASLALADNATPAPAKTTTHHSSTHSSKPAHPKTDLNTATKEDLMK